jgi:hypothetical protein
VVATSPSDLGLALAVAPARCLCVGLYHAN